MPIVRTLGGDLPPAALSPTLIHEHLVVDVRLPSARPPAYADDLESKRAKAPGWGSAEWRRRGDTRSRVLPCTGRMAEIDASGTGGTGRHSRCLVPELLRAYCAAQAYRLVVRFTISCRAGRGPVEWVLRPAPGGPPTLEESNAWPGASLPTDLC